MDIGDPEGIVSWPPCYGADHMTFGEREILFWGKQSGKQTLNENIILNVDYVTWISHFQQQSCEGPYYYGQSYNL